MLPPNIIPWHDAAGVQCQIPSSLAPHIAFLPAMNHVTGRSMPDPIFTPYMRDVAVDGVTLPPKKWYGRGESNSRGLPVLA